MKFKTINRNVTKLLGLILEESNQEERAKWVIRLENYMKWMYKDKAAVSIMGYSYYSVTLAALSLLKDDLKLKKRIWAAWNFAKFYVRMLYEI